MQGRHAAAGLKALVTETRQALEPLDAADVNGFFGRDMRFEIGDRRFDFIAQDFLGMMRKKG